MKKIFFLFFFCVLSSLSSTPLYRLDETMWSFKADFVGEEIRICTPGFDSRTLDYELACLIAKEGTKQKLGEEIDLSAVQGISGALQKKWQLVDIKEDWYKHLSDFSDKKFPYLNVRILRARSSSSFFQKIKSWFQKKPLPAVRKTLCAPWDREREDRVMVEKELFSDPFTTLATEALQTDETPFVTEKECRGSYGFVLRNSLLSLELLKQNPNADEIKEQQAALDAFLTYLKRTFAWGILDNVPDLFQKELDNYSVIFKERNNAEEQLFGYLKCSFEIDFEEMIKNQKPLLPDHVFKCNIGVNNIEMPQVESLFLRILHLLKKGIFEKEIALESPSQFFDFLNYLKIEDSFSLKEIRGIHTALKKFASEESLTSTTLGRYLDFLTFFPDYDQPENRKKIRDLTAPAFHSLMEILFVDTNLLPLSSIPSSEPEKLFTGRKIVHLGIKGAKTMGNKDVYDPCRNLFELLHFYPILAQRDELFLNEILACAIVKKSLWSHYPARFSSKGLSTGRERRVARLIPFPSHEGEKRWYYVDGLLNDGKGDFNYVLLPASRAYLEKPGSNPFIDKKNPLIKLYRNTSLDSEAESGEDSLLADTNPEKIGSLDFEAGDEYEEMYFGRCTMPLWIGYLILGDVEKAAQIFRETPLKQKKPQEIISKEDKIELLVQFITWQKFQVEKKDALQVNLEMRKILSSFIEKIGEKLFTDYLTKSLEGIEWEKEKIAQDIYFIGHSLGGALAQSGVYHFGPEQNRIPLFGCAYKCYAYDSPGATRKESTNFLEFGRQHIDLLSVFSQKWEIHYQFEYADLVPQGGECFLGIFKYNPDLDTLWLYNTASLCKPNFATKDTLLTTTKVHIHRFNHAQPKIDYDRFDLTTTELNTLKNDWILSADLRKKFGYEWSIPRLTETLRRGLPGTFAFAYFWTKKEVTTFSSPKNSELDKEGVMFCTYGGRSEEAAENAYYPRNLVGILNNQR